MSGPRTTPVSERLSWVRHHRIDLALHLLSVGDDPHARPLLLLHGLGEKTPESVPEVVSWLGPVYGLDFTGHGLSTVPVGGGYTSEILTGDVDAVLEGFGQVTILGRGLGAYIALMISAARPAQVVGAVLTDGPGLVGGGVYPGSSVNAYPEPNALAVPDPFALLELARDIRPPDYAQTYVRLFVERSDLRRPITVSAVVRPAWLAAVVDEPGVGEDDVRAALAHYAGQGETV
ncbi:MAG: alpha/beta hydrolase [Microthrixaceae bacterium]